ncbi:hypothetical protein [Guptibacillus sedimenti]|uniref:hypothetical protein n=1 Tax=Guptibacillus sedimenti TaxID=3025680 RepID=UPI0030811EE1
MGDIKLFKLGTESITELEGQSVSVEKSIQEIMEQHLETFLGVRFLASEYTTGKSMLVESTTWVSMKTLPPLLLNTNDQLMRT